MRKGSAKPFSQRSSNEQLLEKNFASQFPVSKIFSAKSLCEIIYLPRELVGKEDFDLVRSASTLKIEKN